MDRKLNHDLVRETAEKAGFSFTKLAKEVGVSTESVSKWLNGEAVPRPGVALKLSRVLKLSYEQLFGPRDLSGTPQVAFRLTRNRAPTEEHHQRAHSMARMYEQLVPYLPFSPFEAPVQLKSPSCDYDYLEALCQKLRRDMGVGPEQPIPLTALLAHLSGKLQAVVVPVFWEHRAGGAELAAHIYSPATRTTWIPFNLDTKVWDATFWIAHEMAHAYTFGVLSTKDGEAFADGFAGSLVMPEAVVRRAYEQMVGHTKPAKHKVALDFASRMLVSPICVCKQVDRFAAARKLASAEAESQQLYPAVQPFLKRERTLAMELFPKGEPSVAELCEVSSTVLRSPFFETLSKYLKTHGGDASFIQGLLDCPLIDAKSLNSELA
jgi:transcriptional regulator with XRE-family HTH domain